MKEKTVSLPLMLVSLLVTLVCATIASGAGPTVYVMPDGVRAATTDTAYAWAGLTLDIWGKVKWGDSTSGTYTWDFDDGTPVATGTVTNAKNISVSHAYAAGGTYYAKLTVTASDGQSDHDEVRIDVLATADRNARVNLSIERGLKWLYLNQAAGGNWGSSGAGGSYYPTTTALSVLAFENRGHLPISDPAEDIYYDTVKAGLNYLCSAVRYSYDITPQPAGNPDTHGIFPDPPGPEGTPDGRMVDVPSGRSNYEHGIVMLAFAAAGPYTKGTDPYDAVKNPALNLMGTIQNQSGGTITLRYYDILAGMVDYVAWAQADTGGGRGGWRYSGNQQDSDTSVAQWPAIGCEAAEGWELYAPAFVKSELLNYWLPYTTYDGGTWAALAYQYRTDSNSWNVTHGGAGLCMLSWCNIPKTDSRITKILTWLDANWAGNRNWDPWNWHMYGGSMTNYYCMYGVAKGCRIARDNDGKTVSEIQMIGSKDWYDLYVNHVISQQQAAGNWMTTMSGYHSLNMNTPLAILVLEPTIAALKPIAVIAASPNPTPANQTVNFDISGSYHQDPNKWLTGWQIDFDGNGTWDRSGAFPQATPVVLTNGYPDLGHDYDVTAILRVTDNVFVTDDKSVTVQVRSGNVPPVADAGGPYSGAVGAPICLDGTGSYDPNEGPPLNDEIVSWEWDINGNGVFNDPEDLSGPTPCPTWFTPYVGKVYLRVTDKFGLTDTTDAGVTITATDLWPTAYPLISQRRVSRTVYEYTWKFEMENRGNGGATNVAATLNNWPSNVSIIDGSVSWPAIDAGQKVTSADTFTLRIDRSIPVANSSLTWILEWDEAGGVHRRLVNFPLFP